uniref:Uncharacterized protein n=1 Tax=Knipowitschia caucasica TaxID=637954 RepID=A0AAV2LNN1_KNICA
MSSPDSLRWERGQAWTQSRDTPPDTREDISSSKVRRQEVQGNGNTEIMVVHEEISRLLEVEKTLEEQLKVNAEQKQRLNELQQTIHERDAKVNELEEFLEQRDALIDFGKGLLQKKDKDTKDLAREVRNRVNAYVGDLMKEKMELQNSCVFLKKDQAYLRDQLDQADEQHQQDQDQNEKLEAEVSKLKDELKRQELTEQELTQTDLERNALQSKVNELKEFLEQKDALIDFGKDLLKKKDKDTNDLAREVRNRVNAYVGDLMKENIELQNCSVFIKKDQAYLRDQLDQADEQHQQDQDRNEKLEAENFGKDLLKKKDKDTNDLAREVRNRVNAYVGDLMKENIELQNCSVFIKKDQAYLRDQLDQADEQHQQDQDRNEKLEDEVSKLKDELKRQELTEQELTQTDLERNALQRTVDELKEFLEQRDTLIDFGKDLLKKKNKEFKDLAREFQNKVNAYVGDLLENYIHLKDHCVDLEDATVHLQQKLDKANQQHLEDEVRNTELESELAKMKKLQQHQQQKIQDLERTSQDLEEQLDEAERYHIQDAVENLKNVGELGEIQRKLKKSEAENKALKTEIQNEQDKIKKKTKKRSWWKCWE